MRAQVPLPNTRSGSPTFEPTSAPLGTPVLGSPWLGLVNALGGYRWQDVACAYLRLEGGKEGAGLASVGLSGVGQGGRKGEEGGPAVGDTWVGCGRDNNVAGVLFSMDGLGSMKKSPPERPGCLHGVTSTNDNRKRC